MTGSDFGFGYATARRAGIFHSTIASKQNIALHDPDIVHPLKEVDASATGWAQTSEQAVAVREHVLCKVALTHATRTNSTPTPHAR